jgi:flagellar assembly protein FliH
MAPTMSQPQPTKFNFDNVFGTKGGAAQAAAPRARSTFSAAEVETIRQEMFSQGKADTEAASAALRAQTLGAIAQSLTIVVSQFDAEVLAMRQESAALALAVGRKLAENALAAFPLSEVEALVADCLHKLHNEPRLVIRVPADCADPIRADIDALCTQHGFDGRVIIIAEPALTGADCRVEWANGGIERDLASTFASIEQSAERWRASTSAEET